MLTSNRVRKQIQDLQLNNNKDYLLPFCAVLNSVGSKDTNRGTAVEILEFG